MEVEESDVRNRITRLEAQMGAQWRVLAQQGGAALLGQRVQEETSRERVRQERVTELERNVQELAGSVESLWAAQQALVRERDRDLGEIRQDSLADRERIAEMEAGVGIGMEDLRQQVRRLEDVAEGAMARVIQADRARSVEGRAKPDPEPGEMSRWMVETLEAMASGGGTVDDGQESPRVSEEETRGSDGGGRCQTEGGHRKQGMGRILGAQR